jgi:DNA-binding IclR family transcriptional regulator
MAAQPVMKRLTEGLPAHTVTLLCRLFRSQVMCVHQESTQRPDYAVSYERGRPMPLFRGAASKIILAHMSLRAVKALYAEQAAKFAQAALGKNWAEVKEKLRTLRTAGLSVTYGELDPGMCGISVPVFETEGVIVGSLSVVIPVRELTPERLHHISTLLSDAAREVSWTLSLRAHGESRAQPPVDTTRAREPLPVGPAAGKSAAKSVAKSRRTVRQERRRARAQS